MILSFILHYTFNNLHMFDCTDLVNPMFRLKRRMVCRDPVAQTFVKALASPQAIIQCKRHNFPCTPSFKALQLQWLNLSGDSSK